MLHRYPLLLIALLAGCRSYQVVSPQPTPVLMVDQGVIKTFRPVLIEYSPPFSKSIISDTYLMPEQIKRFDLTNAEWAVAYEPAWHKSAAYQAGRWISAGEPAALGRWLVSANPVVVALSADHHPNESGVHPITLEDLDQKVSRLLVLDPWQTPPQTFSAPPPGVRQIDLSPPKTLREVLHEMAWK